MDFRCLSEQVYCRGNGASEMTQRATLAMNTSAKFECRWVDLETQESPCVFTSGGVKARMYLPVAHAEGRFTAPTDVLEELEANHQVVFRYAESRYPNNPNGSDSDIAGICDATGKNFRINAASRTVPNKMESPALDTVHWGTEVPVLKKAMGWLSSKTLLITSKRIFSTRASIIQKQSVPKRS